MTPRSEARLPLRDQGGLVCLPPPAREGLCAVLARLRTLEELLRLGPALPGGPLVLVDLIVQDEYTHDVVMACAGAPPYLVFDST